MAQQRYFNYKENDSTDFFNRHLLGILPYGLYAGFDAVNLRNNLSLELEHSVTGLTEVDVAGNRTVKLGILRTQQGVVIKEDAPVTVGIAANSAGNPRLDTIVVEHEYEDEVEGGSQAIYRVIQGVKAVTPLPATLPYPERQMVIGYLFVPGGMAALNEPGVIYTRVNTPTLGNDTKILRQNVEQYNIVRKQLLSVYGKSNAASVTINTNTLNLVAEGNYFVLTRSSDEYLSIDTVIAPYSADTYVVDILCFQRLKLRSRTVTGVKQGNLYVHQTGATYSEDTDSDVYIEEGETIRLIDRRTVVNTAYASYFILKGGEVTREGTNKLNGELAFNRGTVSAAGGELTLDGKGNYYRLELEGDTDISWIPQRAPLRTGLDKQGGIIFLSVMVAPNPNDPDTIPKVTLIHDEPNAPDGALPISTPSKADFALFNGDVLVLIEEENSWVLASIIGLNSDVRSLTERLEAYMTSNNASIQDLQTALENHLANYEADKDYINQRIDNIVLGALEEARELTAQALLEPAVILKGLEITSVQTDASFAVGNVTINGGIATLNDDVLTVPSYAGPFPIYLQRSGPGVGVWRTAPTVPPVDRVNYIRFAPFPSQYLADVVKRAANPVNSLRMMVSYNQGAFDTTGLGRWAEYGFALSNGQNGTADMTGLIPVGFNPLAAPENLIANQGIEYKNIGAVLGEKKHTLTILELASHSHGMAPSGSHSHAIDEGLNNVDGNLPLRANGYLRKGYTNTDGQHTHPIDNTGGGQPHENRQPSRVTLFLQRITVQPAGWQAKEVEQAPGGGGGLQPG